MKAENVTTNISVYNQNHNNADVIQSYSKMNHEQSLICSKCHNIINISPITVKYNYNIELYCQDGTLDLDSMIDDLIPRMAINNFQTSIYCPVCQWVTTARFIDYDIGNIISILNKNGYHTLFSCAGHGNVYEPPYIAFSCSKAKLANLQLDTLKGWYYDNDIVYNEEIGAILRCNINKLTVEEFRSKQYLTDLYNHLAKILEEEI